MGGAAFLGRNLGAQRHGDNWRCMCPRGCGYGLSLTDGEDGRLLAHCFGGCDFADVLSALVEYGLFDDDNDVDVPPPVERCTAEEATRRIEEARAIYQEALPPWGTIVEVYARARGVELSEQSPVRFSPYCPHRLGMRLPAMVAPVVGRSGAQFGIHMTFLHPSGCGKADFADPQFQRETRGIIKGGAIRLAPLDPKQELVIAEGLETALSAMRIFELPTWAAVYAGNLKSSLDLPLAAQRILIAADNDASGTGQRAALAARERWRSEGREVRIVLPRTAGDDFNDVLTRGADDRQTGR